MSLPIRARLAIVSSLLMASVLVAVGLFIYTRLDAELTAAVDTGLASRAEQIVAELESGGKLPSPGAFIDPDEAFAQVFDARGAIVESSAGLADQPMLDAKLLDGLARPTTYELTVATTEEQIAARLFAVPTNGQIVVVGASLEEQRSALNRLAALSLIGGAVALVLSALVSWLVTGAALRPVERMRRQAAAISSSQPGARLPVPDTADELARLGQTLNQMLDRLEEALERERRFVSDASHELRTPLANLKAELDLALRRPRDEADLLLSLRSAAAETDRVIRLAEDLLVQARAESTAAALMLEPTDVNALVRREIATFEARAAEREVTFNMATASNVSGTVDRRRLRQALGNVLENAVRHSPAGGVVRVQVDAREQTLVIQVSDAGDGFDEQFLPIAFEPFSRSDAGRARSGGGSGLGLAITASLIESHGGSVTAANDPSGGAVVTLRIPLTGV